MSLFEAKVLPAVPRSLYRGRKERQYERTKRLWTLWSHLESWGQRIRATGRNHMARIPPLEYEQAAPDARVELDRQLAAHGRVTNMKRTLAHAPAALHALMQWYPLRETVLPFLGERLTTLFTHAVSTQTDCLICSTFFRRILIESGEDPDKLTLDER